MPERAFPSRRRCTLQQILRAMASLRQCLPLLILPGVCGSLHYSRFQYVAVAYAILNKKKEADFSASLC